RAILVVVVAGGGDEGGAPAVDQVGHRLFGRAVPAKIADLGKTGDRQLAVGGIVVRDEDGGHAPGRGEGKRGVAVQEEANRLGALARLAVVRGAAGDGRRRGPRRDGDAAGQGDVIDARDRRPAHRVVYRQGRRGWAVARDGEDPRVGTRRHLGRVRFRRRYA